MSLLRFTVASLVFVCGCSIRHVPVNYFVPAACITKAELFDCSLIESPPSCKLERVTYKKGCEELVTK